MDWSGSAQDLAEYLRGLGPIGPVVLFVLFVLQCIVAPIPSEPMMMAAGFVYGPQLGGLVAWAGVVVGGCACFGLARRYGRPFVERFVKPERLADLDGFAEGKGRWAAFLLLLGIRVFAFTAFDVVSYGFGLVKVPFPAFLLATAIGVVPKVAAFTYLGVSAGAGPVRVDWAISVAAFGALLIVPIWWRRRRLRNVALDPRL